MIEVPNPRAEGGATIRVYRTWTLKDIKEGTEHIPRPEVDVEGCIAGIHDLHNNYYLNGREMQSVLMHIMGLKWHQVKGDWQPTRLAGQPPVDEVIPHQDVLQSLNVQDGIFQKMRNMFVRRANYGIIGQTKQKEGETIPDFRAKMHKIFEDNSGIQEDADPQGPFQQQMKMAILQGLKEPVRNWLQKNYVGLPTCTKDDFITHAIHADKVIKEKQKKNASQIYITEEGVETYVVQQKKENPKAKTQNRKVQKGTKKESKREIDKKEGKCYLCHKKGHLAKQCSKKQQYKQQDDSEEEEM